MSDEVEWRDIPGYEGLYQVSSDGRVWSMGKRLAPRMLKLHVRKRDGYVTVGLHCSGKQRSEKVHRLVALAFVPNPEELPDVDHRDGDKQHNRVENLRWASKSTNGLNRINAWGEVGVVGVFRSKSFKSPYRSWICVNGVHTNLGVFATVEDASAAYQAALKKVMENA